MTTLSNCNPFYVRCIKPNMLQQGSQFDAQLVQEQLKYLGMMETIRVRYENRIVSSPHLEENEKTFRFFIFFKMWTGNNAMYTPLTLTSRRFENLGSLHVTHSMNSMIATESSCQACQPTKIRRSHASSCWKLFPKYCPTPHYGKKDSPKCSSRPTEYDRVKRLMFV